MGTAKLFYLGVIIIASTVLGEELKVTSILDKPYLMQEGSGYVGFIKDLMDEISADNGFTYKIQLVKDGHYGVPDSNNMGQWNGMVGEVMRGEADVAAAPLTITYLREQFISFTKPYMNFGISLLMNKQDVYFRSPPDDLYCMALFLSPFPFRGWLLIVFTTVLVFATAIFIRAYYPGEERGEETATARIKRACKTTICSKGKGDDKKLPMPLKVLCVFFLTFSLIVICLYVAGLVWIIRNDVNSNRIRLGSVKDVIDSHVGMGALFSGSTYSFFKFSDNPIYRQIYRKMTDRPDSLVKTTADGIERVKEGGYGFFAESTLLDYTTARSCDLIRVGKFLNSRTYGLATKKNSSYTDMLSSSILRMVENGKLTMLRNRWLSKRDPCPDTTIDVSSKQAGGTEYRVLTGSIMTLLGPSLVMLMGIIIAIFLTLLAMFTRTKAPESDSTPMDVPNDGAAANSKETKDVDQAQEA